MICLGVIIALVASPCGPDFYVMVPDELFAQRKWGRFVKGVWAL